MKSYLRLVIVAAIAVTSWAEQPTLPVKGQLHWLVDYSRKQDVSADVILRLFDKQQGGTLVFQERQTVQIASDGIFVAFVGEKTRGGVPARVTDAVGTLWAEYAHVSAPGISLSPVRQQITYRKSDGSMSPNAVSVSVDPSLCYTCGGAFPIYAGSFSTAAANTSERSSACGGSIASSTDSRPFLCGR